MRQTLHKFCHTLVVCFTPDTILVYPYLTDIYYAAVGE